MPFMKGLRGSKLRRGYLSNSFLPTAIAGLQLWLRADVGLVTDGGANFAAASSQSLSIADNADMRFGATDFTVAFWTKLTDLSGDYELVSKDSGSGGFTTRFSHTADPVANRFEVIGRQSGGADYVRLQATTFGLPSTGTWYFICVTHNATTKVMSISVNNGTFDTQTGTGVLVDSNGTFQLGVDNVSDFLNGNLDSVGKWNRVLSASEITTLYNSGNGLRFVDLSSSITSGLLAWYDFATSGSLTTDSQGSNTLTNNNGVTYTAGIASGAAVNDGAPVSQWSDQSGNGSNVLQSTGSQRPALKLNIQNGMPVIRFDGVDDFLRSAAFGAAISQPDTIFFVAKQTAANTVAFDSIVDVPHRQLFYGNAGNRDFFAGTDTNLGANDGNWHIWNFVANGASSTWRVDGGNDATINAGTNDLTGLTLATTFAGTFIATIDIAEMLIYTGALALGDRNRIRDYLNKRWATF